MVADEEVSAFAVYTRQVGELLTKKQIKRQKLKEKLKIKNNQESDQQKFKVKNQNKTKSKVSVVKPVVTVQDEKKKLKKIRQKSKKTEQKLSLKKSKPNKKRSESKSDEDFMNKTKEVHPLENEKSENTSSLVGFTPTKNKPNRIETECKEPEPKVCSEMMDDGEGVREEQEVAVPISRSSHYLNRERKTFKTELQRMKSKLLITEARQIAMSEMGSDMIGKKAFAALIRPIKVEDFMSEYWEKNTLYIPCEGTVKFKEQLISTQLIDTLLRQNQVMFGKHVDVTSYTDGVRETLNPDGRAHAHVLWDYYTNGCSIRLLNPQYFLGQLHTLLATLQEYFGCLVGANAYLTPPGSQGFAPHYDDIEAFVYQVEGRKRWRVYKPRTVDEVLPRYSSPNYTEEEVGEPILDVTLSPGDILYFPRGFIHQANTLPGEHSLHLTISTYQKTSWGDLLEKAIPRALKKACEKDVRYRRGLPLGYLTQAGLAHPRSFGRKELVQGLKSLVSKLEYYLDVDAAVDDLAVQFMHDSLPPVFNQQELKCSVYEGGLQMSSGGRLSNNVQLKFGSKIRLLRSQVCRLVEEWVIPEDDSAAPEQQIRLYYTVDNSREYHGQEPQYVILPMDMLPAVHFLIGAYPGFVRVQDLPCDLLEAKIALASDLWDRGILMTDTPLQTDDDDNQSQQSHPRSTNS